jgi:hypothetical protein
LLDVLLGQPNSREQVFLLVYVIRLENGREHREAVFGVERGVEIVSVDPCDLLSFSALQAGKVPADLRLPLPAWQRR